MLQKMSERHTKISELFGISVATAKEYLQKISERYLIHNWSYLNLFNFSKEVSQITDIEEFQNYLVQVYKHPRNFRKIYHTELEISLNLFNFSKKVTQLTD